MATTTHAAGSTCNDIASCEQLCHNGTGPAAACRQAADLLASGAGNTVPNHARAATLYELACGVDSGAEVKTTTTSSGAKVTTTTTLELADGDADACFALSELVKTGWLFEVERDFSRSRTLLDRAQTVGAKHCVEGDTKGCAAAARAAAKKSDMIVDLPTDADKDKAPGGASAASPIADVKRLAETGCKARDFRACEVLSDNIYRWQSRKWIDDKEQQRLREVIKTGLEDACYKDADGEACLIMIDDVKFDVARAKQAAERACQQKDAAGCIAKGALVLFENGAKKDQDKFKQGFDIVMQACETSGHDICLELARSYADRGIKELNLPPDAKMAVNIYSRRCSAGNERACEAAAKLLDKGGAGLAADKKRAKELSVRACQLTSPDDDCDLLCVGDPGQAQCKLRLAYGEHSQCFLGRSEMCEVVGRRFRDGGGIQRDHLAAARHFRRGCDGAQKSSCAALDELCVADTSFDRELCHQSLIHSDLFYEAEWQFRTTGVAKIAGDEPDKAGAPIGSVAVEAAASGGGGVSLERGHLDADLVVNIVLDRARQAAIELVVSELKNVGSLANSHYLRDLLAQGAALLADPSTLRREKFQDLAMTVVRAFVASNLVDTLFPTAAELYAAPVIGPLVKQHAKDLRLAADGKITGRLHSYLIDVAYELLAMQNLFSSAQATVAEATKCPFDNAGGKALCKALTDPAAREKLLQVGRVLEGLRMAKAVRDVGTIDLRRFIEALTNSRAIADLDETPGLVLRQWRVELIDGVRSKSGELLAEITDLKYLLDRSVYADTGADLAQLAKRAESARRLVTFNAPTARILLGRDAMGHVQRVLDVLRKASIGGGLKAPGPSGNAPEPPTADLAAIRKAALDELVAFGATDVADALSRLRELETTANTLRTQINQLETAVYTVETTMKRFRHQADVGSSRVTFDIGDVPLHAISDLRTAYSSAAYSLRSMKEKLLKLYPGQDQPQIEFALSATVRLLGFFNLMERLARATRLTQTCADVMQALQVLGSRKKGEFVAPLYDVLEPVLSAVKTHEPMSIDLLFAVIARVRLDTLVSSLQGTGDACKKDSSVDCWTVKVIHALQESVEREGTMIRIDGGKFAQRLASHGDDFRHAHKWRGYFHLTVGAGALQSKPLDDPMTSQIESDKIRRVPLISEQIGFGIASPTFFRNHLTLKLGAAASGLLYRAVVDSEESKAIMVHPLFIALDVSDLVEAYISPLTLLVYPPTDTNDTSVRWGISAGLSVPLSAYLERL